MADHTLIWTTEALHTITDCEQHLAKVKTAYGQASDEYLRMLESWAVNLAQIVRLGGRISKDGPLSFYGTPGMLEFGCVYHPDIVSGNERHPLLGSWLCHS